MVSREQFARAILSLVGWFHSIHCSQTSYSYSKLIYIRMHSSHSNRTNISSSSGTTRNQIQKANTQIESRSTDSCCSKLLGFWFARKPYVCLLVRCRIYNNNHRRHHHARAFEFNKHSPFHCHSHSSNALCILEKGFNFKMLKTHTSKQGQN